MSNKSKRENSAQSEAAPIWRVIRFCCTSGMCTDCKQRGNLFGDKAKRARIVHADKLTKAMADKMVAGWANYDARAEVM